MRTSGNTVLITGGATGIGLALACALLRGKNEVLICGRRAERLEAAKERNPALGIRVADVSDPASRSELLGWIEEAYPKLNVLVNNAGVQHRVDFRGGRTELRKAEEEVATNLLAPIHLASLFLPLLSRQPEAAIVNVSSGLAFAPLADMPVYCATKAALHSISLSLRHQLRRTSVRVFEVIPPIVASELGASHRPREVNRSAMPAEDAAQGIVSALGSDTFEVTLGDAENLRRKREELFPLMNRG
jgi:uncharacterized oxidoreductase